MARKVEAYADAKGNLYATVKAAVASDIQLLLVGHDIGNATSLNMITRREDLIRLLLSVDAIDKTK